MMRTAGRLCTLPTTPIIVRLIVELLMAAGFAVAVYEAVVAGALAVWPGLTDSWVLLLWITAATVSVPQSPQRIRERFLHPATTRRTSFYAAESAHVSCRCASACCGRASSRGAMCRPNTP
jgi:hypothetical protein